MNHPDNYKEAYEQMVGLFTALKSKYKDCRKCWLDFLKQEADKEAGE